MAMVRLTTLAALICQVVAAKVSTLKWKRRESTEPTANEIAARTRMTKPARLRRSGGAPARVAAGQRGFHQRDQDGDHRDDQRGVTGGDFGLGPDEQDVVGGHEEDADEDE